ncbi:MAG: cobalamin biosynthesis protein CobW [Clostridia bacterium]|nr:cobalamin biosynthesis protein CobW [Clostridia bacterium]
MTKIDIFSGFLGAGKTTLIKKLIEEAFQGEKLVLIENEFGEIGIDGGFLQEAGINVTEMNSGCICCSLVGDFGKALAQVLETYHPDRVLIEPSGVGKLSDVIAAVKNSELDDVKLNSFTTVADASKCKIYAKNFGEFYNNQIEHAGCIILSRSQNLSEEKVTAAVNLLREKNEKAAIIATPWDQLSGAQILEAMEQRGGLEEMMEEMAHHEHHHHHHDEECDCGCHDHHHEHHHHDHEHEHHHDHGPECTCGCHDHHHHHADEVFTSWGKETTCAYSKQELEEILDDLDTGDYGTVLRAKGMVANTEGGWLFFDYVPGEQNVREGTAQVIGRICVIGSDLDVLFLADRFGLEA